MRALLVDDNRSLQNVLKTFLLKEGWEVQTSGSWKEACPLIEHNLFDLFVLDILLPDKQGFEILEILSKKNQTSFTKIALISGFFDAPAVQKKIPLALKKQCVFFKKPIQEEVFLNFLKDLQPQKVYKSSPFFDFFFDPGPPQKALKAYLPEQHTFDSKDLIPSLFLTHLKQFTGDLNIETDKDQKSLLKFYEGTMTSLISNSEKSFFGNLLVEHGLSLPENIQGFLVSAKNSNKRLGEKLVEEQLLSPQMLNFILKEQIKIRLSEMMDSSSFQIKVINKIYSTEQIKTEIDFNELDFIEWLADSLKTEFKSKNLEKFYLEVKNKKLQKSSKINRILINHKDFLKDYNLLFTQIQPDQSIKSFIRSSKRKTDSLKLLYFGLLTKSIFLRGETKEFLNGQKMESILDSILEKDSGDLFAILNLPWKASTEEVEKNYRQLIQTIHPDLLPPSVSTSLRKKAEETFEKITTSYKQLKEKSKREKYIQQQTEKNFMNVIVFYEEGIQHIKNKNYKEGLKSLLKIADHKQAPSDTLLYTLWAQLKSENTDLLKNRKKGIDIKQKIDSCSISLRTSPLFWYVKGLFYIQIQQYEKAKKLFKKSLQIKKNFISAKEELILIKKLGTQKKQNLFQLLLKKSS